MTGCPVAWKWRVACRLGEESQHPTCPHSRQSRSATQRVPSRRQSSHACGVAGGGKLADDRPARCWQVVTVMVNPPQWRSRERSTGRTSSSEGGAFALNVRRTAVTQLGCHFRKLDVLEVATPPDIDAGPGDNTAVGKTCLPAVCRLTSRINLFLIEQINPECFVRDSEGDQRTS